MRRSLKEWLVSTSSGGGNVWKSLFRDFHQEPSLQSRLFECLSAVHPGSNLDLTKDLGEGNQRGRQVMSLAHGMPQLVAGVCMGGYNLFR